MVSKALKQSIMDFQLSCTSHIPWIWVIETLLCSNQVDVSLFLDLAEKSQEISDDLGRNARELVSLRILEIAFDLGASSDPVSSTSSPKVELDLSESCEDVLKQILLATSTLNLRAVGLDMLKLNLEPFIVKKRSSLIKFALRQLKDAILTGSHPLDALLKRKSELFVGAQPEQKVSADGSCGRTPNLDGTDKHGLKKGPFNLLDLNNDVGPMHRNLPDENLLPTKRDRSCTCKIVGGKSCDDEIARKDDCENCFNVSKKYKHANNCHSTEVPCDKSGEHHHKDMGGNKETFHDLEMTREEMDKFVKNIQRNVSNAGEAEEHILGSKITDQNINGVEKIVPINASNANESEELTIFSESWHDKQRTDNSMLKNDFLSSQCLYSLDSLETSDLGEKSLCVKCGDGGCLLVCSSNACTLVVHESCLGSAVSFDSKGIFYCPSCAYSRAIKQYEEAKKNTCSANKDLTTFYCFGTSRQLDEQPFISNQLKLGECVKKTNAMIHGFEESKKHQSKKIVEDERAALSYGENLSLQGKHVASTNVALPNVDKNIQDEKRKGNECPSLACKGQHKMAVSDVSKYLGENSFGQALERDYGIGRLLDISSKKGVLSPPKTVLSIQCTSARKTDTAGTEGMSDKENESSDASEYIIRYRNVKK